MVVKMQLLDGFKEPVRSFCFMRGDSVGVMDGKRVFVLAMVLQGVLRQGFAKGLCVARVAPLVRKRQGFFESVCSEEWYLPLLSSKAADSPISLGFPCA